MEIGNLLIVHEDQYLFVICEDQRIYEDGPFFPLNKITKESLMILLGIDNDEHYYNVKVLLEDGRVGYLSIDYLSIVS